MLWTNDYASESCFYLSELETYDEESTWLHDTSVLRFKHFKSVQENLVLHVKILISMFSVVAAFVSRSSADFMSYSLVDSTTGQTVLPGQIYVPPESTNGPRPFILFMHGAGTPEVYDWMFSKTTAVPEPSALTCMLAVCVIMVGMLFVPTSSKWQQTAC